MPLPSPAPTPTPTNDNEKKQISITQADVAELGFWTICRLAPLQRLPAGVFFRQARLCIAKLVQPKT